MPLYIVFMSRIANQLEGRGFPIVKMAHNKKKPQYMIYYFEDTLKFRQALREITKK